MKSPMYQLLLALLVSLSTAEPLLTVRSDTENATYVDLVVRKGPSQHVASGFIYGIPDTFGQIPSHFYENIGFNYGRAGGAQEGAPSRGWIWGLTDYYGRLNSTLTDYKTCREFNAGFILLPHDVWGTDQANSSTVWPGDNGDWTDYDNFVTTLMSDLAANDALEGLVWDIWNEPDGSWFWARSMQQWIDLYIRTHKLIRANSAFDGVKISGPTLSASPYNPDIWWTSWLSQIAGNDTIPDQIAYHLEAGPGIGPWQSSYDLTNTYPSVQALLRSYGIPNRPQVINEYASYEEQIPSGAAFWISRLERYEVQGLRGNWQSGNTLHDLMANLLTKSDPFNYAATDYMPGPEYSVYEYYYQNMTGCRLNTTGSVNLQFDVYATVDDVVRILAGGQTATGNWTVTVENLTEVGLPQQGSVSIRTLAFNGNGHYVPTYGPVDLGVSNYSYSGNNLVIPIDQRTNYTAYAFEFTGGHSRRVW
ncbi:uncharacterized protein BHQ10_002699 [Talaromyces amestolkiae]|uniref:Glycoside hydrolase family 39 protein n=1 Tax=Talaromyces amestolkiae TaxID=1196081 RepID=A0A364KT14_TALAM|nr:uncharacterized protein BHQ10_002699 [Talaromyces amestolkiae]RAO66687.1 hypothetical protein BHQ10_002699 [Talaromyces amestolkiae]